MHEKTRLYPELSVNFPPVGSKQQCVPNQPIFFIVLNNRYILQDFTSKSRDQNVILVIFPFLYTFRRVGFVKETASAPANRFVYSSIEATHCKHDRARAHVRS